MPQLVELPATQALQTIQSFTFSANSIHLNIVSGAMDKEGKFTQNHGLGTDNISLTGDLFEKVKAITLDKGLAEFIETTELWVIIMEFRKERTRLQLEALNTQ